VTFDEEGLPIGWKRTFVDEFNGRALDLQKWNTSYHWYPTVINNELQAYVSDAFEFKQGILKIRADQRTAQGQQYTSGSITTMDRFVQIYGYFEMRAKMPKGTGFWPGFWLMMQSKEWPPEIDVVEYIGSKPDWVALTFHSKDSQQQHQASHEYFNGPDFSADFHRFGLLWAPRTLVWYVDGVERARYTGDTVPNQPMYLLTNMAVGGEFPGPPDKDTVFPAYFEIDYIRAYLKPLEGASQARPPIKSRVRRSE
jgi:beta-glucanase (GH16 family)